MMSLLPSKRMSQFITKSSKSSTRHHLLLLDPALLEALLNTKGNASRDSLPDLLNVLSTEGLAESGKQHTIAESKGLVGDLARTEVLGSEGGDKLSGLAVRVVLGVNRALVEGCHHALGQLSANDAALALGVHDSVLGKHLGDELAGSDDLELGRTRVDVESVHATGVNTAESHAGTSANEGRESLAVGGDELATLAGVLLRLVEVEDEVFVLGEELEAIGSTVMELSVYMHLE